MNRGTYERAKKYAASCGVSLSQLAERALQAMMSIPPSSAGITVLMPLDECLALRRVVAGDSFDSKVIDDAIHRIERADEVSRQLAPSE